MMKIFKFFSLILITFSFTVKAEFAKAPNGKLVRWYKNEISVSFEKDIPLDMQVEMKKAIYEWSYWSGLDFYEIPHSDTPKSDITFHWHRKDNSEAVLDNIAETYYRFGAETGEMKEVNIYFNTEYWDFYLATTIKYGPQFTGSRPSVDIDNPAKHEMGHALGLAHNGTIFDSIMVPGRQFQSNDIEVKDINDIQFLYYDYSPSRDTDFNQTIAWLTALNIPSQIYPMNEKRAPKVLKGLKVNEIKIYNNRHFFDLNGKYVGRTQGSKFIEAVDKNDLVEFPAN